MRFPPNARRHRGVQPPQDDIGALILARRRRAQLMAGAASDATTVNPDTEPRSLALDATGTVLNAANTLTMGGTNQVAAAGALLANRLKGGKLNFSDARHLVNSAEEEASRHYPATNFGAQIAASVVGGKAIPSVAAKVVNPFLRAAANVGEATAMSGVQGTLDAEGDFGDRLSQGKQAALMGGGMAGAAHVAGGLAHGVINIRRPSENGRFGEFFSRYLTPIEDQAAGAIANDFRRDKLPIGNLFADAADAGEKPAAIMDLGGRNTVRRARGVESSMGPATQEIEAKLTARQEGVAGGLPGMKRRVISDVENALPVRPEDRYSAIDRMIASRRANAQPLYEKAYAAGAVDDPAIRATLELPAFRAAFKRAQRIAKVEGTDLPDIYGEMAAKNAKGPAAPRASMASNTRTANGSLRQDWLQKSNDNALVDEMHSLSTRQGTNDAAAPWVRQTEYGDVVSGHRTGRHQFEQDGRAIRLINAELKQRGWTDDEIADALMTRAEREGMAAESVNDDDMLSFITGAESPAASTPTSPAPSSNLPAPTVQTLDYIKRGLDDLIEAKMRGGSMGRTEARALRQRLSDMLDRVDAINPDYAKARAQFAGESAMIEAHQRGVDFLKTDDRLIARDVAKMSPSELEAYRIGALDNLTQTIRDQPDGYNVVRRIFDDDIKRDALKTLVGDDTKFQQLKKALNLEDKMSRRGHFVLGGSPTPRIQAEQADNVDAALNSLIDAAQGNAKAATMPHVRRGFNTLVRGETERFNTAAEPLLMAGAEGGKGAAAARREALEKIQGAAERNAERAGRRARLVRGLATTTAATPEQDKTGLGLQEIPVEKLPSDWVEFARRNPGFAAYLRRSGVPLP